MSFKIFIKKNKSNYFPRMHPSGNVTIARDYLLKSQIKEFSYADLYEGEGKHENNAAIVFSNEKKPNSFVTGTKKEGSDIWMTLGAFCKKHKIIPPCGMDLELNKEFRWQDEEIQIEQVDPKTRKRKLVTSEVKMLILDIVAIQIKIEDLIASNPVIRKKKKSATPEDEEEMPPQSPKISGFAIAKKGIHNSKRYEMNH